MQKQNNVITRREERTNKHFSVDIHTTYAENVTLHLRSHPFDSFDLQYSMCISLSETAREWEKEIKQNTWEKLLDCYERTWFKHNQNVEAQRWKVEVKYKHTHTEIQIIIVFATTTSEIFIVFSASNLCLFITPFCITQKSRVVTNQLSISMIFHIKRPTYIVCIKLRAVVCLD